MPEWSVTGYTELKRIGSGGFGYVVVAKHDVSGTLVAVKYLREELLGDPEFAAMFRGEATVLVSLDDPNIVRLYEYVESPAGAAIVMELIGGVSVRDILKFHGKTTAEGALAILHGSLLGLAAAHRRGVVHRDYKPENVLVDRNGTSKLTDFGIAARAGDPASAAGTLRYAAPEQMAGAPATPASDIYAATATFYECLTGRPPFTGDTAEMLLSQHRSDPVPVDSLPAPLRPLVTAGLAKDPAHRPTDATTFVTELNTAAADAYGRDWHDRGRSHLAEAALLLAALWPAGPPPAAQGTTVQRVPLRRRVRLRHVSGVKGAIAVAGAITIVAAGSALAVTRGFSYKPNAADSPLAVQPVSLQPTGKQIGPASLRPASVPPSPPRTSTSTAPLSNSRSPSPPPTTAQPTPSLTSISPVPPPTAPPSPPPTTVPPTTAPPPTTSRPSPPPTTTSPAPVSPAVPVITSVSTYTEGELVYFDIHYSDPGNDAEGFGFVGVDGSGWAEETHPFSSPSYGIVGPDSIAYPFNEECGTSQQYDSYVQAWIYDTAGASSAPVVIHLVCAS